MSKKGFPSAFFFSLIEKRKFIGVSLLFSTNLLCKFVERWRKRKENGNLPEANCLKPIAMQLAVSLS